MKQVVVFSMLLNWSQKSRNMVFVLLESPFISLIWILQGRNLRYTHGTMEHIRAVWRAFSSIYKHFRRNSPIVGNYIKRCKDRFPRIFFLSLTEALHFWNVFKIIIVTSNSFSRRNWRNQIAVRLMWITIWQILFLPFTTNWQWPSTVHHKYNNINIVRYVKMLTDWNDSRYLNLNKALWTRLWTPRSSQTKQLLKRDQKFCERLETTAYGNWYCG